MKLTFNKKFDPHPQEPNQMGRILCIIANPLHERLLLRAHVTPRIVFPLEASVSVN